jgi:hypothetical protein
MKLSQEAAHQKNWKHIEQSASYFLKRCFIQCNSHKKIFPKKEFYQEIFVRVLLRQVRKKVKNIT